MSLFLTDYKRDYLYNLRIPLYVAVSALILMIGIFWLVKFITFINVALTEEIQAKIDAQRKFFAEGHTYDVSYRINALKKLRIS